MIPQFINVINIILCVPMKFSSEQTTPFWSTSFKQDQAIAFIIFKASLGSAPKWIYFPFLNIIIFQKITIFGAS